MPMSFSHTVLFLFTFPLLLLQLLQNCYRYFCHCYHYYHTTLLLNTLLQILSYPGVVELTTQLLILANILWLPLCRINKFGLNTLPLKAVAIPYTCGLSDPLPEIRRFWHRHCCFHWEFHCFVVKRFYGSLNHLQQRCPRGTLPPRTDLRVRCLHTASQLAWPSRADRKLRP